MASPLDLHNWFGDLDVYLFDQLLKGRFVAGMRVLDAGCGGGRNLNYLMKRGFEVCGIDKSPEAIAQVQALAALLAPNLSPGNFRVELVESMSFADEDFDVVISSAVLHFARDEDHWHEMVREMWRVLKPGGIFFARLASTIGIEDEAEHLEGRRYRLPDRSTRFLVDEQMLLTTTAALGGEWIEPFKTVVVQHQRAMSNWVVRKRRG